MSVAVPIGARDHLYSATDWQLQRQKPVAKKLAALHLSKRALVLNNLILRYLKGKTVPLAKIGYSRDGKRKTPQVNYGLLTMLTGCPVAISV